MELQQIIELAVSGTVTCVSVVSAIIGMIKAIKAKNTNQLLCSSNKVLSDLAHYEEKIKEFMADAEATGMAGASKRIFTKSQFVIYCQANGIEYDDEVVDKIIDSLIQFSNKVNARVKATQKQ